MFEETEEDNQALHEVIEYVRVSALLCFAELGKEPTDKNSKEDPSLIKLQSLACRHCNR